MYMGKICEGRGHSRSKMRFGLPVLCLAAILAPGPTQAQNASRRPLIEYGPAGILHGHFTPTNSVSGGLTEDVANNDAATPKAQTPRRQPTSAERWEKFETDFEIGERDRSPIKGSLVTAKYQLDRALFGIQEFVRGVQDAVSFDCELRSLGRPSSSTGRPGASSVPIPWWDTLEKARLQFDIDVNMGAGRAFVGVRLMLPIGD